MTASLKDRTVLVIGRAGGIAEAVCRQAKSQGANVVAAAREKEDLDRAYADKGIATEAIDVTDESSVSKLADRLGTVDHIVCTASARARGKAADLSFDTVAQSMHTKVVGPIMLAKYFAPKMPEDGSFVFMSGGTARKPQVGMLAVAVTNAGVDAAARSLAVELAPIRVNSISPGTIDTGAYDALGKEKKAALYEDREEHNPVHRVGTSDDVADAVMFALSNTFLTGVSLSIDGGETIV